MDLLYNSTLMVPGAIVLALIIEWFMRTNDWPTVSDVARDRADQPVTEPGKPVYPPFCLYLRQVAFSLHPKLRLEKSEVGILKAEIRYS
jgi:hypothetical protein